MKDTVVRIDNPISYLLRS